MPQNVSRRNSTRKVHGVNHVACYSFPFVRGLHLNDNDLIMNTAVLACISRQQLEVCRLLVMTQHDGVHIMETYLLICPHIQYRCGPLINWDERASE